MKHDKPKNQYASRKFCKWLDNRIENHLPIIAYAECQWCHGTGIDAKDNEVCECIVMQMPDSDECPL